jgi:hypothetical protein
MSTNENGEEVIVEDVDTTVDSDVDTEPTIDWKAKAEELQGRLKRAETKLSKAPKAEAKSPSTSDGLDYGMKALLRAEGIKGDAETKLVQQFMSETGKDIEQVLDSKFFKSELEEMRELARTEAATPSGKRSGNTTVDSVEYWLTKPIEDVPKEMRTKVVNAKLEHEKTKGVFYNS